MLKVNIIIFSLFLLSTFSLHTTAKDLGLDYVLKKNKIEEFCPIMNKWIQLADENAKIKLETNAYTGPKKTIKYAIKNHLGRSSTNFMSLVADSYTDRIFKKVFNKSFFDLSEKRKGKLYKKLVKCDPKRYVFGSPLVLHSKWYFDQNLANKWRVELEKTKKREGFGFLYSERPDWIWYHNQGPIIYKNGLSEVSVDSSRFRCNLGSVPLSVVINAPNEMRITKKYIDDFVLTEGLHTEITKLCTKARRVTLRFYIGKQVILSGPRLLEAKSIVSADELVKTVPIDTSVERAIHNKTAKQELPLIIVRLNYFKSAKDFYSQQWQADSYHTRGENLAKGLSINDVHERIQARSNQRIAAAKENERSNKEMLRVEQETINAPIRLIKQKYGVTLQSKPFAALIAGDENAMYAIIKRATRTKVNEYGFTVMNDSPGRMHEQMMRAYTQTHGRLCGDKTPGIPHLKTPKWTDQRTGEVLDNAPFRSTGCNKKFYVSQSMAHLKFICATADLDTLEVKVHKIDNKVVNDVKNIISAQGCGSSPFKDFEKHYLMKEGDWFPYSIFDKAH